MVAGILVILALLVGTLGVVAIVSGSNLASFGSGESRDSQQVAEAGADQIIATFNQPENRQLLVAGSTAPSTWSTTNMALQSPCLSSQNTRPGSNGDGMPSSRAVGLADGQFRNLDDITKTNEGTRRFVLRSVRYSAGTAGSTDRRAVYRTFTAPAGTWGAGSQAGTIPTGTTFNSLLNLDQGGPSNQAGVNTGFIAVTVEGRLYRADGTYSTSTITKEYEVLPKCCGGSFGSQGSGGSSNGEPFGSAGATGALGADSRFCGVQFGLITGINGGRFWSQQVDRRYTQRNAANQVVNIGAIVGIVDDPTYIWDRTSKNLVGNTQAGCRTIPSPCNVSTDINPAANPASNTIPPFWSFMASTGWALGKCGPEIPAWNSATNTYSINSQSFGDKASFDGRAASCVPIVPLYLKNGLPSIASKYTYPWTAGGNPETVVNRTGTTSANPNGYPQINAEAGDVVVAPASSGSVWIRGNKGIETGQVTPGPFLEYCNVKYTPNNQCESVFNGSQIHTWAVISSGGAVTGGIEDNFESNSLSGYNKNSTPRWPSTWVERDTSNAIGSELTTGDLQISGGKVTFQDTGVDFGGPGVNAPAIARAVNLYALKTPVLEFTFSTTGAGSFTALSALRLDYSFTSPITTDAAINTDTGWVQLATIRADGILATSNGASGPNCVLSGSTYTCRIAFPPAAYADANRFRHFVKFRLRANSNFGGSTADRIDSVDLDNIAIRSSTANPSAPPEYLNWCEYSSIFPVTA